MCDSPQCPFCKIQGRLRGGEVSNKGFMLFLIRCISEKPLKHHLTKGQGEKSLNILLLPVTEKEGRFDNSGRRVSNSEASLEKMRTCWKHPWREAWRVTLFIPKASALPSYCFTLDVKAFESWTHNNFELESTFEIIRWD